jgi:hypothetical protein
MAKLSQEVIKRGYDHDLTKLEPEELPHYVATIDEFDKHPFGTEGYKKAKESLGPSVQHHYKHNRHHPEHFPDGVDGMNLIDLLEMVCDWKAATQNHPENVGDMQKSIQWAEEKYKISPQLANILYNTARDYGML